MTRVARACGTANGRVSPSRPRGTHWLPPAHRRKAGPMGNWLIVSTRSRGGRQAAHRMRPLRCQPGTEVAPGRPRAASLPSRQKGQIAAGFPEPETLTSAQFIVRRTGVWIHSPKRSEHYDSSSATQSENAWHLDPTAGGEQIDSARMTTRLDWPRSATRTASYVRPGWAAGRGLKATSGRRALGGRRCHLPGRARRQRLR